MFDVQALYRALDAQRAERELTWPAVAQELWETSGELARQRGEDHPIAVSTLTWGETARSQAGAIANPVVLDALRADRRRIATTRGSGVTIIAVTAR